MNNPIGLMNVLPVSAQAQPFAQAAAPAPSDFEMFMTRFFGGGGTPAQQEQDRNMMGLMAAGTQLGGAIAGPNTVVGDASQALNQFAQGSIMSRGAEATQNQLNDAAQRVLAGMASGQAPTPNVPQASAQPTAATAPITTPVAAPTPSTAATPNPTAPGANATPMSPESILNDLNKYFNGGVV